MTPRDAGYGAILTDPPWPFRRRDGLSIPQRAKGGLHYDPMAIEDISAIDVRSLAAEHCALFCWITWPRLKEALTVIEAWGFRYKTCAFCWVKAKVNPLFPEDYKDQMGLGYWTRSNSEVCLLATRGNPKRQKRDVRQVILEPRREHSRKPDTTYERIERLVDGPYLEMFARQRRPGWDAWGNETEKFNG